MSPHSHSHSHGHGAKAGPKVKSTTSWLFSCCVTEKPANSEVMGEEDIPPSDPDQKPGKGVGISALSSNSSGKASPPSLAHTATVRVAASPMHTACIARDVEKCRALLASGEGKLEAVDADKKTPLHYSATAGHMPLIQFFLEAKADLEAQSSIGETPLHCAAEAGTEEAVKLLLASGANPNALTVRNDNPLHIACARNHPGCAQMLLDSGADINVKNSQGYTVYAVAEDWGGHEVTQMIKNAGGQRH